MEPPELLRRPVPRTESCLRGAPAGAPCRGTRRRGPLEPLPNLPLEQFPKNSKGTCPSLRFFPATQRNYRRLLVAILDLAPGRLCHRDRRRGAVSSREIGPEANRVVEIEALA